MTAPAADGARLKLSAPSVGRGFHFDEEKHFYTLDGRRLWSVTDRLVGMKLVDPRWYTWQARERGRAVHRAVHLLLTVGLDWASLKPVEAYLGEAVVPRVQAAERFLRDSGFRVVRAECPGYHKNYLYAGCTDVEGFYADGQEALLDWKTGAYADAWEIQLGGYDEMMPRLAARGARRKTCVELKANGDYYPHHMKDVNAGGHFLALNDAHQWGLDHGVYMDERAHGPAAAHADVVEY